MVKLLGRQGPYLHQRADDNIGCSSIDSMDDNMGAEGTVDNGDNAQDRVAADIEAGVEVEVGAEVLQVARPVWFHQ